MKNLIITALGLCLNLAPLSAIAEQENFSMRLNNHYILKCYMTPSDLLEYYNDVQVPEGTTKAIYYGGMSTSNTPTEGINEVKVNTGLLSKDALSSISTNIHPDLYPPHIQKLQTIINFNTESDEHEIIQNDLDCVIEESAWEAKEIAELDFLFPENLD